MTVAGYQLEYEGFYAAPLPLPSLSFYQGLKTCVG